MIYHHTRFDNYLKKKTIIVFRRPTEMKTTKSVISNLDIFAIPFKFTLGENEKGKKTFIGGILSLLIGVASLCYFGYLCYLYWNNKIAPSTSIIQQYSIEPFHLNVAPDTFAIQILLSNGKNLQDYQNETNTVLLHILSMFSFIDDEGNIQNDQTIASPCESKVLKGYYCLKFQKYPDGTNFIQRQTNNSQLILLFSRCVHEFLAPNQKCESDQQIISNLLISLNAEISIKFILKQYNSNIKEYVNRLSKESFTLDDNISFITYINLKKTDSTISDGLLIQKSETNSFLSDYNRNNIIVNKNAMVEQLKFDAYGGIIMSVQPDYTEMQISFPQFTYVMAQFSSIFNSLLFIGFLSKIFAESEICHEMMALQLQVYYKLTALQLLGQKESKIDEIKGNIMSKANAKNKKKRNEKADDTAIKLIPTNNNSSIKNSHQNESKSFCNSNQINQIVLEQKEFDNKNTLLTENQNEKSQEFKSQLSNLQVHAKGESNTTINIERSASSFSSVSLFLNLYKKVQLLNFKTFFSQKMKISTLTRIYSVLFPSKSQSNKSLDYQIYKKLQTVSSSALSVFKLQKDILTFKIILRLLLSPDQYAAALLCGSKIQLNGDEYIKIKTQSKEKDSSLEKEGNKYVSTENKLVDGLPFLNHLEMIDQIEEDEQQLEQYVSKFLSKLQTKQQLSDIDLRIRDSMIGSLPSSINSQNQSLFPYKKEFKVITFPKEDAK